MMKTRITRISRRTISIVLALLMMVSMVIVVTVSTSAASTKKKLTGATFEADKRVYLVNKGNWTNAYIHLWTGSEDKELQMTKYSGTQIFSYYFSSAQDAQGFRFISKKGNRSTHWYTGWVNSNYAFTHDNSMSWQGDISKLNGTAKIVSMIDSTGSGTYTKAANANCVATVSSKNLNGGTASIDDTSGSTGSANEASCYPAYGATVNYTATASNGYVFRGFSTTNSSSLPSGVTSTKSVTSNAYNDSGDPSTVYAYFSPQTYTITYNAGANGTGTVSSTTKVHGQNATLSSSTFSRTGYTQDGWSTSDGGAKAYDLGGSYTTNADTTLYPHWSQNTYTVKKTETGASTAGTVKVGSTTITTSGVSIAHGTYTVTVTAPTGYNVSAVSIGGTAQSITPGSSVTINSVAITAAKTIAVTYALKTYTISLSETGATGGTLKVDDAAFTSGSTVTYGSHTFRVDAPDGYEITSISGIGTWTINETYATLGSTAISSAQTISVTYTPSTKPQIRVDYTDSNGANSTSSGSVTTTTLHDVTITFTNTSSFSGKTYTLKDNGTEIKSGTVTGTGEIVVRNAATLTAGAHEFVITCNSKSSTVTVNVTQARTLTVNSASHVASISGSYTDEWGNYQTITTNGTYYVTSGTTATVTYTAAQYYQVSGSINNQTISSDTTVTPTVTDIKHTVSVSVSTTGTGTGGTVSSSSITNVGYETSQSVTATANTGYTFSGWTIPSGVSLASGYTTSDAAIRINATADNKTITAKFTETKYDVTLNDANHTNNVSSNAIGIATSYSVTAASKTGYSFSSWTVSGSSVRYSSGSSTSSSITITARSAVTLTANYTEIKRNVTIAAEQQNNVDLGTVSPPSGSIGIDTGVSATATPRTGYEFKSWTGSNLSFTPNSATTTIKATGNYSSAKTATANFRQTRLYLDISGNATWKGATYYKVYFFKNGAAYTTETNSGFVNMQQVDGVDDMYYVDLPGTFNTLTSNYGFIFVAKTDNNNNWNNKTAQSGDLTFEEKKNKYIIDSSSTSWAASPYFPPATYTITVNASTGGKVKDTDTGTNVSSTTVQVSNSVAKSLPTPTADYGYKFKNWTLVSGSVKSSDGNTTYSTAGAVISTSAFASIRANSVDATVQANFELDANLNIYIEGRFKYNNNGTAKWTKDADSHWSDTSTELKFSYDSNNNYYYFDTGYSIGELSETYRYNNEDFPLYFYVKDKTDSSNEKSWHPSGTDNYSFIPSNSGSSNAKAVVCEGTDFDHHNFRFNDTSSTVGPVKIYFDPVTQKVWFDVPEYNVTAGSISSNVAITGLTLPTTAKQGSTVSFTVTPNNGYSIATISYTPSGGTAQPITGFDTSDDTVSFTMPDKDVAINVNAVLTPTVTITSLTDTSGTALSDNNVKATQPFKVYYSTANSASIDKISFAGTDYSSSLSSPYQLTTPETLSNVNDPYTSSQDYVVTIYYHQSSYNNITGTTTVTVHASYTELQQEFKKLKDLADKYYDYGVTEADTVSGWSDYSSALTAARGLTNNVALPQYNDNRATTTYSTPKSTLQTAYNNLVFKTNTVYVLVSSTLTNASYVRIYFSEYNKWLPEKTPDTNKLSYPNPQYKMTKEGTAASGAYLFSFTYCGRAKFKVFYESGNFSNGTSKTGTIDLKTSSPDYGNYYVDSKSNTSTTTATPYVDFDIDNTTTVNDILERDSSYTLKDITDRLGITYRENNQDKDKYLGSLHNTSSEAVTTTIEITASGSSTPITLDSSNSWQPTVSGRYTLDLTASIGEDSIGNSGASFSKTKRYYLYVAFDEITIYADMNGNVGTPTIYFDYDYYRTENNTNVHYQGTLPYEFDMVTGSESIYSVVISLKKLKTYDIDLLAERAITVNKLTVDDDEYDEFNIDIQAAKTGTAWLKANSTSMTGFDTIAFSSSVKTFKAKIQNANNSYTAIADTFADISGTGIITDGLNNGYYEYSVLYAAIDPEADYKFSYNVKATAAEELTISNSTYYFEKWKWTIDSSTSDTVNKTLSLAIAPEFEVDDNVVYEAIYRPTSYHTRLEITYKFKDFDTTDGNYVYDPDKKLKDETYVKTVDSGSNNSINLDTATSLATDNMPIIKSNYFDYEMGAVSNLSGPTNGKYKCEVTVNETAHKYKINVAKGDATNTTQVKRGFYQKSEELTASQINSSLTDNNVEWYIKDSNGTDVIIGKGQTYTAKYGIYQDAESEDGYKYDYYTIRVRQGSGSVDKTSTIFPGHQQTYYDSNGNNKARHNFFIIDNLIDTPDDDTNRKFIGGGVVYATADGNGYRQTNAEAVLGNKNSDGKIRDYIKGIIYPADGNTQIDKGAIEFKAQTINNIGFRYLPYDKGRDVFRYSDVLNAYQYIFAGENTNSDSFINQTLRVFSYFIYTSTASTANTVYSKDGTYYNVAVSSTYAEVERYIEDSE